MFMMSSCCKPVSAVATCNVQGWENEWGTKIFGSDSPYREETPQGGRIYAEERRRTFGFYGSQTAFGNETIKAGGVAARAGAGMGAGRGSESDVTSYYGLFWHSASIRRN